MSQRLILITLAAVVMVACSGPEGRKMYVSEQGDDSAAGTLDAPWKTISKVNSIDLEPGDVVAFRGGDTFHGTLRLDSLDHGESGNRGHGKQVLITSYGEGVATIHGGKGTGVEIHGTMYVGLKRLKVIGDGRKEGNAKDGIVVSNSRYMTIDSIDVSGFQKAGLLIFKSHGMEVSGVRAHNNGFAGISLSGQSSKDDCGNIGIYFCHAENNAGDPTNLSNHSGNGIILGYCRNVNVRWCTATNNGWDMPRIGNGPVGIWAYEADSIHISRCESYRNRTSKGGEDGGGFDLDGGVTNSMIERCLSYENEGAGFGIFQYPGASRWENNTLRFNISFNDGLVSTAHAGIYVWNGSGVGADFGSCYVYNNTIVNTAGAAIRYSPDSQRDQISYFNNIFIAKEQLIFGDAGKDLFLGNDWWSLNGGFKMDGTSDLKDWLIEGTREMFNGEVVGFNVNPGFEISATLDITREQAAADSTLFHPTNPSLARVRMDLRSTFGIDVGNKDLAGQQRPTFVGAVPLSIQ